MLQRSRRSRGQNVVIFALALPALVGVASLATDIADLYLNWFFIQTATDSSVLSGASYLPGNPSRAISTANNYAASNGIKASEIASVQVTDSNSRLTMQVNRQVPFYFGAVLGASSGTAHAKATALVQTAGANGNGLRPFGIDYRTSYTFGQQILIKAGQVGPGNWEPLALGANGADVYRNNIEFGYSGPKISVGDFLPTETGVIQGPTRQAVDFVINQQQTNFPGDNIDNLTQGDPRIMLVPLVDFSGINGKSEVPVKGFAEIWLVGMESQFSLNTVFVKFASGSDPAPAGTPSFGALTVTLVE